MPIASNAATIESITFSDNYASLSWVGITAGRNEDDESRSTEHVARTVLPAFDPTLGRLIDATVTSSVHGTLYAVGYTPDGPVQGNRFFFAALDIEQRIGGIEVNQIRESGSVDCPAGADCRISNFDMPTRVQESRTYSGRRAFSANAIPYSDLPDGGRGIVVETIIGLSVSALRSFDRHYIEWDMSAQNIRQRLGYFTNRGTTVTCGVIAFDSEDCDVGVSPAEGMFSQVTYRYEKAAPPAVVPLPPAGALLVGGFALLFGARRTR